MAELINTKISVYGKVVNNRVVFHPMEGCDGNLSGAVGELTRRRYLRFAKSGAGIIWFEAVSVSNECRANPRQLYLNENTLDSFKSLIAEIKAVSLSEFGYSPLIIMQMTHSGRFSKPTSTPEPIIAYHNELWEKGKEDLPYTVADDKYCDTVIEKYAKSAHLATLCGFDGIDVKCCHGYLFDEFLSAKERSGKYGGSLKNRTRLYFSCIDAVRANISPEMFVTTRLNACDCFLYPYGFGVNEDNEIDLSETKSIINSLKDKGIELINLTLGNPYLIPHINRPCPHAPESGEVGTKRIYKITKELQVTFPDIKFIISGLSYMSENCIEYAEKMLREGVASLAGFGRMTFAYPDFYTDYLKDGKLSKNKCCIKCGKCTELMRSGSMTGCPVRDSEVYLPLYKKYVLKK